MSTSCRQSIFLASTFLFYIFVSTVHAAPPETLICSVDGSNDDFIVYPEQVVYSSASFSHYQLIRGLTVLVVNKHTLRFNRLSNLNLLPSSTLDPAKKPENIQIFSGSCIHQASSG